MFKLSYNANGLRHLTLAEAIEAVAAAGYDGIELSLHPNHLDPAGLTRQAAAKVRGFLQASGIEACCLATGADNLLGEERFEPSLINPDPNGRRIRVDLIRRAVQFASWLEVPVVNFASGIRKPEVSRTQALELLVTAITQCLEAASGDVVLAIEPEPGFLVETNDQAVQLINHIGSRHLRLSQDLGHANVVEDDYLDSVERSLPLTRHIQVEDIKRRHHRHEIPGDGDIDFRGFFDVLRRGGYAHHLSVELYNHGHVYEEALQRSVQFLRACDRETAGVA